jgi:tetratricopeptide (TPR) repeat protein
MKPAEMSGKRMRRNIIGLLSGLFMIGTFSPLSFGATDGGSLLGLRDKGELYRIVGEAEKVYEKNPKDKDGLIRLGIAYHNLAIMEVKGASAKAFEYLKQVNKLLPEDPLILAVLGSSITMVGRDASNIVDKMRYVNEGTPMIDKAVNKAPDNVFIRMTRSENSAGLPKMFGRINFVKEDLLHIEGIIKRAPKEVPVDLQTVVYYKLGNIFRSEKDESKAKSYFKKAAELSPDSEWGKRAKREL